MRFFFVLCFILFFAMDSAGNPLKYTAIHDKPGASNTKKTSSVAKKIILLPLAFYSKFLSPANGPGCPSYPSCSTYARQSIKKHGALLGSWLTIDRLIHEHSELDMGLRITRQNDGRAFVLDTLQMNDPWL